MNLGLDKIRIDCGTQARAAINPQVVVDYCEEIKNGTVFPPVTAYFDGVTYYLADGFHRYLATKAAGSPGINTTVINGTLREAILFSLKANNDHGLRRTNADKRKAVMTMLDDFEWADWSAREIADACMVGHNLVSTIKNELGLRQDEVLYQKNGKVHVQKLKERKDTQKEDDSDVDESTDEEKEQLFEAVDLLKAENEALTDRLAVVSASPEKAERDMAQSLIEQLRNEIKLLNIQLKAVTQSRDTYQSEKAQLMKQNAMLQKKLKQYEDGK